MRKQQRALVIGGSLGGLFAANLLHAIGWHVEVYERVADDLATRGAGIGTHDELFSILRRLGITVDASIGVEVHERVCLDHAGRVLHEVALPQMMTAWARIYRPLKDLLPAAQYHFGVDLERIEEDADGITAIFSDGTTARGDLLVAADGIRSTVRAQVLPQAQPRYAGYVAWRGVVDESAVSPATHAAIFERYAFGLPGRRDDAGLPGAGTRQRRAARAPQFQFRVVPAGRFPHEIAALRDRCDRTLPRCRYSAAADHAGSGGRNARRGQSVAGAPDLRNRRTRAATVLSGDLRSRIAAHGDRPCRVARRCGVRRAAPRRHGRDQSRARCAVPGAGARGCARRPRRARWRDTIASGACSARGWWRARAGWARISKRS